MPIRSVLARPSPERRKRRAIWMTVATVTFLLLVVLGFLYRRFILSGLDLVGEATGGRTSALLTLVAILLSLFFVIIWMLFPLFVYLALRDLGRRTAELDRTASLCATHLARLASTQLQNQPVPGIESSEAVRKSETEKMSQ